MTLKELREQIGKTPKEIADVLKISLQTVYRYEQGIRKLNISQVLILSELFDCTAEEVIKAQLNSCLYAQ